ncbi:hypothetical protein JCM8202_002764 [Rhodotorula sphaerocarpa]
MRSYRRTTPLYLAINWVLLVVLVGATREKRDADAVRMRTHRGKASDWIEATPSAAGNISSFATWPSSSFEGPTASVQPSSSIPTGSSLNPA